MGDKWSAWLMGRRDGGDPGVRRDHHPALVRFRDGVLQRAAVREGDVVLDVGTGTGLIGFGALEQVGASGRVIFSDVSEALLDECRRQAGDDARCEFVRASADDLAGIADGSVDVVTTRSVLMYLPDKGKGFRELARVLRPGGRLAVFEPINSFAVRRGIRLFGFDLAPVDDLVAKLLTAYRNEGVIADFDERDLLRWAGEAGFTAIELDYRAEVEVPEPPLSAGWERLRRTAPNPLAPTYEEAIARTMTVEEAARFEAYIKDLIDQGAPRASTMGTAYLKAVRPDPPAGP
ncbi:class I SAM-dependent methyltransferase [Actinoplanes sp. NPDC049265]|uniref:class I SAM-dependent methyltransferase n=1 Tax=Actinoplanes sp. NPDC049265 TaxID=3363902 RepID=UPI003724BCDB